MAAAVTGCDRQARNCGRPLRVPRGSLPGPFAQQQGNDDCNRHGACTPGSEVHEVAVAIGERALKYLDQSRTRHRQPNGPQHHSRPIAPPEIPEEENGQATEKRGVSDLVEHAHETVEIGEDLDDFFGAGQRSERRPEQQDRVDDEDEPAVSCDAVQLTFFWYQGS